MPKLWLFRGSPSAALDWATHTLPSLPIVHVNANDADLRNYASDSCSEPLVYVLVNYTGSLQLNHPPEADIVIPLLSIEGDDLKIGWKTTYPKWLTEVTPPQVEWIREQLRHHPAEIVSEIERLAQRYPQVLRDLELFRDDPDGIDLIVNSQLDGYGELRQWLRHLRTDPVGATVQLDDNAVTAWFARYPDCLAAKVVKSVSHSLWFYLCIFIDHCQQRALPYAIGLRLFAYWFQSVSTIPNVVKWRQRYNKLYLWITPTNKALTFLEQLLT